MNNKWSKSKKFWFVYDCILALMTITVFVTYGICILLFGFPYMCKTYLFINPFNNIYMLMGSFRLTSQYIKRYIKIKSE